jgi:hypothetical protein
MSSTTRSVMRIEKMNYLLGAAMCLVTLLVSGDRRDVLGVAIGVGLTCANFAFLRKLVFRWADDVAAGRSGSKIALIAPKMMVLMVAVVVCLWFLPISPVMFVIGYSVFVLSIMVEGVYMAFAPQPSHESNDG